MIKATRILLMTLLAVTPVTLQAESLLPDSTTAEDRETAFAYLVTNSRSANVTSLHLVNLTDESLFLAGTLYGGSGEQLGPGSQPLAGEGIAPRSRLVLTAADLETLFQVDAWQGPALLEVEGSTDFQVISKLTSPSGLVSNSNCVSSASVHNIEGEGSAAMTWVRLINQGSKPVENITATLYQADGRIIGAENQQLVDSLAPRQAIFLDRDNLIEIFAGSWTGEASLVITSESPDLRLLNLNLRDRTFFNFSCQQASRKPRTLNACTDPRPEACTLEVNPVCAERDNGVRCVTTPCQSTEWETYSNGCGACSDPLVFGYYAGSCEDLLGSGDD